MNSRFITISIWNLGIVSSVTLQSILNKLSIINQYDTTSFAAQQSLI